jgi:hypothetical protein
MLPATETMFRTPWSQTLPPLWRSGYAAGLLRRNHTRAVGLTFRVA